MTPITVPAPLRRRVAPLALAALFAAGLTACGSTTSEGADTTTPATPAATGDTTVDTTTDTDADTTAGNPATTEATAATTGAGDTATAGAPVVITASVAGGAVSVDQERVPVPLGSEVSIQVDTDVAEPVHLHGYDIEVDAAPGSPARIDFTADIPGVFEVELEDSGTLLFEIEVS